MGESTIEWTDAVWNPVRGCDKISPGCKRCYASTFAERWRGVPGHPYEKGFDLRLVPEKLGEPLRWKKPQRVFVNSMSDLFHEDVPSGYAAACFLVMQHAARHTFQVLTKRAERMAAFAAEFSPDISTLEGSGAGWMMDEQLDALSAHPYVSSKTWPLPNVWMGVSVEDGKYGLPRVDHLRKVSAAVRFLSIEPLLEDIADDLDLTGIHWVIVGGESGPGARECHANWIRKIVHLCQRRGVPVFVKQLGGAFIDEENGVAGSRLRVLRAEGDMLSMGSIRRLKNKKGADMAEWPPNIPRIQQFPEVRHAG